MNSRPATSRELAEGVIAGERRALSRAITLLESERPEDEASADALLDLLIPHTGRGVRVGVSGPPGVGKSTLIDAFGLQAISGGERVAVLAVDPSSRKTGGSILGDKTRMARLAASAHSYIRPSPSRGEQSGIAPRTREAILACEAAGYGLLLIETVGVGQAEIEIAELVDCLVVLLAAGAGDELQGMKRGLLEHGDVFAVTKADGEQRAPAERAASELASALALATDVSAGRPPVLTVSASEGTGVMELADAVHRFVARARASGQFEQRRRSQGRTWFTRAVEQGLRRRLLADPEVSSLEAELGDKAASGAASPRSAARELLALVDARLQRG